MSLALSASLGVAYDEIATEFLVERVLKFAVNSKAVGFLIYNLRSALNLKVFSTFGVTEDQIGKEKNRSGMLRKKLNG